MQTIVSLIGTIIGGLCFSVMWRWYAMPLGVPSITVPHAIGLTMLVRMATYHFEPSLLAKNDVERETNLWMSAVVSLLLPPLMLFAGWVVHWFM